MLSLLSSRLGLVVKSLAGLSCTQTARCISLPNALNFRFTTARWFSEDKNVINPQKSPSILDLPKRPLTAFLRFSVEQRPLITAKHPDVSLPKRSRMIGEKWRELTDAERQVYRDAYKHDYMKYSENVKKYKASLDPLDLRLLKNIGRQKLENKKRKMLLKDLKASGPPKHPRNSYLLFFSENFHKCKEDSFIGKVHEMMSRWKKLSSKEKQAYKQLFEDDKIRYINELKAWEEQMREIGREDLIQFFMRNKRVSADKGLKEKENKIPARRRNTQPRKQKKS